MRDEDVDVEEMLRRYRVAEPRGELRERVVGGEAVERRRWPVGLYVYRGAVAAVLVVSMGLLHEAGEMNRETANAVGRGPVRWTAEAQEMANLMGAGRAGERYIAMGLIAGARAGSVDQKNEGGLP